MQHRQAARYLARRGLAVAALAACIAVAIAGLAAVAGAAGASGHAPLAAPRDPSYSLAAQRQAAQFTASGATFDPNRLVTDVNFTAVDSLTSAALQQFLAAQTGILATYSAPDHLGVKRSAAAIILQAARAWQVSPKVLLVTLQKEQSLLTAAKPSSTALDWAMGCGVPDTGSRQTKYQGFGNQIWYGAETLHNAAQNWIPDTTKTCFDGTPTPANASTWSLYNYTPWVGSVTTGGNYLFWEVYVRYFDDPLAVDRTAPTATVAGADALWHNAAVTLQFAATDNAGGTGVRTIASSLDGGVTWVTGTSVSIGAPVDHSGDGVHTVLYRATDDAGNVEASQSCTVKIATRQPHPVANWKATVRRGGTAKLLYVVSEHQPGPKTADVVIHVRNAAGKLRATLQAAAIAVNTRHVLSFHCTLPAGSYRFVVNAIDAAGNHQAVGAANTLVVRKA